MCPASVVFSWYWSCGSCSKVQLAHFKTTKVICWHTSCWFCKLTHGLCVPAAASHACLMEQISFYFNHRHLTGRVTACAISTLPQHEACLLQDHFILFHACNYIDCVLCCERGPNAVDLHSVLSLNTSCVDTDGGVKLLLLLLLYH